MPATLQLAGASLIMVILLSLPIGFLCAVYKDGWFDRLMRGLVFGDHCYAALLGGTSVNVADLH